MNTRTGNFLYKRTDMELRGGAWASPNQIVLLYEKEITLYDIEKNVELDKLSDD